jgi:hypothetical protein
MNNVIAGIAERIEALIIGQDKDDIGPVVGAPHGLINPLPLIASRNQQTQGKQNNGYLSHVINSIICTASFFGHYIGPGDISMWRKVQITDT